MSTKKQKSNRAKYQRWKTVSASTIGSSKLLCRVLRKENSRLRWDLNEQTQYADEYHATMTELYEQVSVLTTCRDHWKTSFDHERVNVVRLRRLLAKLHGKSCECADCKLTKRHNDQAETSATRDVQQPKTL